MASKWEGEVEVMVAGGGPVGLLTALSLAEEGLKVQIVEAGSRPAARSYALALHSSSLTLLDELGLAAQLIEDGRRIDSCDFYDGRQRQASVRFAELESLYPFVLVVPQSRLEAALQERLESKGVQVLWNHRLSALNPGAEAVEAEVERVEREEGAPRDQWAVRDRLTCQAKYVVGADGHDSLVRRTLGIGFPQRGEAKRFAVFEFAPDPAASDPDQDRDSQHVAIDEQGRTTVIWPLDRPGFRCGFQLDEPERYSEQRRKSRSAMEIAFPTMSRRDLRKLLAERAPWFQHSIGDITWSAVLRFERRVAESFGQGRCWLAGDAAHLALPVGVQSMNSGLAEARDLAARLYSILDGGGSPDLLQEYAQRRLKHWQGLLKELSPPDDSRSSSWTLRHANAIRSSLPASGENLSRLLGQLGIVD